MKTKQTGEPIQRRGDLVETDLEIYVLVRYTNVLNKDTGKFMKTTLRYLTIMSGIYGSMKDWSDLEWEAKWLTLADAIAYRNQILENDRTQKEDKILEEREVLVIKKAIILQ